ncbi:hypothetical protein ACFQ1L_35550 [Phytohabitans flavus]|uniref:hypothetical protein n=1 Tax=Phytohabitans flavus TaxID=1076124 RepID=UPI00362FA12A
MVGTPLADGGYDRSLHVQALLDLTADTAITIDSRRARPITVTVPEPDADSVLAEVSFSQDGLRAPYAEVGPTFDGLSTEFLGEPRPADEFTAHIVSQWARPSADGTFADSPYLYALAEAFAGRLPTGFSKHYRKSELATVHQRFAAVPPGEYAQRSVFPDLTGSAGAAWPIPTSAPGSRVEYYTTGSTWSTFLEFGPRDESGFLQSRGIFADSTREYRAGSHNRDSWAAHRTARRYLPSRAAGCPGPAKTSTPSSPCTGTGTVTPARSASTRPTRRSSATASWWARPTSPAAASSPRRRGRRPTGS